MQINVKDNRGEAIVWRLVRCKLTCYRVSDEKKQFKFSVYILYLVCSLHFLPSLHFVPGLQSAFCTKRIGIAVFVRASLKFGTKYRSSKKNFCEIILAAMIDVWTVW